MSRGAAPLIAAKTKKSPGKAPLGQNPVIFIALLLYDGYGVFIRVPLYFSAERLGDESYGNERP